MLITLSEAEVGAYITKGINLPGKVVTSITLNKGRKEGSKTTASIVVEDEVEVYHQTTTEELLAMPDITPKEFVPEVIAVAELVTETAPATVVEVDTAIPEADEEAVPFVGDEPLEEAPVGAPATTSLFAKALAEAE